MLLVNALKKNVELQVVLLMKDKLPDDGKM